MIYQKKLIGVIERPRSLNPDKAIAMAICPIIVHFITYRALDAWLWCMALRAQWRRREKISAKVLKKVDFFVPSGNELYTMQYFSCLFCLVLWWQNFIFLENTSLKTREYKWIEDITRWREDMNFMFEWQEQYLTRSLRSLVNYHSWHENIKFISSS